MAQHDVSFTVPERALGKADLEFRVKRDGKVLGRLKVSNGTIVWVPKDASYGYKMGWADFDKFIQEQGPFPDGTSGGQGQNPDVRAAAEGAARRERYLEESREVLPRKKVSAFRFIAEHQDRCPVAALCRKLGVSRSGYYAWRDREASQRKLDDQRLLPVMREIFKESRETYGYPRLHAALKARGYVCGRHRVARIMRENGLQAKMARRFKYHRHRDWLFAKTPNLLLDQPHASAPNQVWVGDVSYIRVRKKWSYIAIVMDHHTRKILGWSFSERHDAMLTREALLMATQTSPPRADTIFHSDQGSEYASKEYRTTLESTGLRVSMSRKGHCWDNAHMESFFGTLKTEMVYFQKFQQLDEAVAYIAEYIRFYNCERLHSSLGYCTPTQYEANAA